MSYQIGQEINCKDGKGIIKQVGNDGWLQVEVNGKLRDIPYLDEVIYPSRPEPKPAGYYSNAIIRSRNGGVRHQFENSIGGDSSNYR